MGCRFKSLAAIKKHGILGRWEGRSGKGGSRRGSEIRRGEVVGDGGRGDGGGGWEEGGVGFKQIEWQTHKHMTHVVAEGEEEITPKFQGTVRTKNNSYH